MEKIPVCPSCKEDYTYLDNQMYVCPMCGHEWTLEKNINEEKIYKDANGNVLQSGDSVVVIKDLKVNGSSNSIKRGTKVKNIRLVDEDHDIDCKIDGFGPMKLKSEFVKKS